MRLLRIVSKFLLVIVPCSMGLAGCSYSRQVPTGFPNGESLHFIVPLCNSESVVGIEFEDAADYKKSVYLIKFKSIDPAGLSIKELKYSSLIDGFISDSPALTLKDLIAKQGDNPVLVSFILTGGYRPIRASFRFADLPRDGSFHASRAFDGSLRADQIERFRADSCASLSGGGPILSPSGRRTAAELGRYFAVFLPLAAGFFWFLRRRKINRL
jgi:hypothetical protein